jgi:hypothetical protein
VSSSRSRPGAEEGEGATVALPLDGFAWRELQRESQRNDVPPSELASFAILYYLADVDSGRIARRIPTRGFSADRERPR